MNTEVLTQISSIIDSSKDLAEAVKGSPVLYLPAIPILFWGKRHFNITINFNKTDKEENNKKKKL